MTSNVMPSIVQIEEESLKQLVTEVKETLATDINLQPASENKKIWYRRYVELSKKNAYSGFDEKTLGLVKGDRKPCY